VRLVGHKKKSITMHVKMNVKLLCLLSNSGKLEPATEM